MPKRSKQRNRRKSGAAGPGARPALATEEEISALIWGVGAEPTETDEAEWEELVASEMLGLFAKQNTWTQRNRLVSQKADCVSFEIGMETITQRQDLETQAMLGQTGGVVWDAAVVLSRFLCQYASSLGLPIGDNARWLELGAGCGAVGIAASKVLPVPVVLSDQQSILPILQKNLLENRCTARATLALLDWGKDGESTVDLRNGFDVIVGADCVFNENLIDVLIESLLMYAGDRTSIVMATELREPSVTSAFLRAASKAFGECRRITLSAGLFATAFPPAAGEEAAAAEADWSGSPVIIFVLRKPRHSMRPPGAATQPVLAAQPEPNPETETGKLVDESIEVSDEEQEQWIEIERLLKLVKPMRLQNAKQRQNQIRQSLVAMSVEERAVAVERLAAALDQ